MTKTKTTKSSKKTLRFAFIKKTPLWLWFVLIFAIAGSVLLWRIFAYAPGDELQAKGNPVFAAPLAKRVLLAPDGSYGYTLDGYGGIHAFKTYAANAPRQPVGAAYWSGWDIARDFVISKWDPINGPDGYTLDAFGGVHKFGNAAAASGGPYFSGMDIARRIKLVGGGGYVLDGFGALHPFKIGTGIKPPLVKNGVYFSGQDIARDVAIKITTKDASNNPTGAVGHILDCHGGITPISIGSATKPGFVDGYPWNPNRCDMHSIAFIEWSKPSGLVVGGSGDFFGFGTYPAPPGWVNPQIGKVVGTVSRVVNGTRRYWILSDYGRIRAYAGPNQPLFMEWERPYINSKIASYMGGRIKITDSRDANDIQNGLVDDGTAKFILDLVEKGGFTISLSALNSSHTPCSSDGYVSNHKKGYATDISNNSASGLNDIYWWIYNNRGTYRINELFYVNFPNKAIDEGRVGTNSQTYVHTNHIHVAIGHIGEPMVRCT